MRYVRIWNEFIRAAYSLHTSKNISRDQRIDGWAAAMRLLTKNMPAYGVEATADTYAAVADVCTSHGRWELALRLVGSALRSRAEGSLITRTASTYVAAFDALRVGKQRTAACALLTSTELLQDFSDVVVPTGSSKDPRSAPDHRRGPSLAALFADSADCSHDATDRRQALRTECRRLHLEHNVPPSVIAAATRCLLDVNEVAVTTESQVVLAFDESKDVISALDFMSSTDENM
jgi:hypothetical protein